MAHGTRVLVLTAYSGGSPADCHAVLTALVCVRCDAGAQTLAIPPAVTVAGVRQAVLIEPGHIHLGVHGGG